ncbi:MAG TPA: hypothetical protein VFD00_09270 [Thermoclostridium sp.]|nr:hypothetical protein [Thermoclostridium sp.]
MVIKALAITIDRIKNGKVNNSVLGLTSYTNGILKNSIGNVEIPGKIKEEYKIEEWI